MCMKYRIPGCQPRICLARGEALMRGNDQEIEQVALPVYMGLMYGRLSSHTLLSYFLFLAWGAMLRDLKDSRSL